MADQFYVEYGQKVARELSYAMIGAMNEGKFLLGAYLASEIAECLFAQIPREKEARARAAMEHYTPRCKELQRGIEPEENLCSPGGD